MLEGSIEIKRVGTSGWCCNVGMELAVVIGLAKLVAVLVETRPSEKPGQMMSGGACAGVTSGVMDHADQVQPVLQGRDGDPTSSAGGVALEERWASGVDSVAARAAPQEAGGCWRDVLGQDL